MKKVITYGTYDLFHEGHYKLLERAKQLGDYLIVGVTTQHFDEMRGKINVVDSVLERVENVRKTGFADEIIIEDHDGQKIEDIQKYGVDVFTVGSDWRGEFDYLKTFCDVVYLERTPGVSSTMLRKGRTSIIRTGIVGTGRIAPRFLQETKYVSGIEIICAYNPTGDDTGKNFHEKYDIEVLKDSYEEFLQKVDAVYIASPNETHYEYAKKALSEKKHVLCEKPMAFTKQQTMELYDMAKKGQVVLLEGTKTAYCPGFQQLITVAKSGIIGTIYDVEACFTRLANPQSRERTDARYGGSFLEFGSYTLLPILKLLGSDYKEVRFDSIVEDGVDLYTKVQLQYENGMATGKTGVGVKSEGQLVISGTKGYILAESPWWLTKRFEVRYEEPDKVDVYEPRFMGDGLRYEISEFVSQINHAETIVHKLTAEESIVMAEITEEFMEERNIRFGYEN